MAGVGRGDMAALGELIERHQGRVRTLAYRFSGRWDVADDVTQEVFLRVHRSAATYKPAAAFSTWLYRIVANLCLDAARRPRLARVPEHDGAAALAMDAEEPLLRQEMCHAVQRAVAELPERQRIVVLLHRFEGLSHAQVAAATGWSEPAVESLLVRAYTQLRERLDEWA
jgi:RNA polymerase sigma-70 factor (ECF subfamily)